MSTYREKALLGYIAVGCVLWKAATAGFNPRCALSCACRFSHSPSPHTTMANNTPHVPQPSWLDWWRENLGITSVVLCDQTVVPTNTDAAKAYPEKLLRIKYYDREKQKRLVFIEVDQAALADQIFFLIFGECSEDANLDRHIDLCPGGHHEKAPQPGSEPLHNFTVVISIALFVKVPIYQLVNESHDRSKFDSGHIQLNSFGS